MKKPLISEPGADGELEAAALWYEEQRAGLGRRFLAAVKASVHRIVNFPSAGALVPYVPVELAVRRVRVKRFPFQVVYMETPEAIHILAIAHESRRPGYWLSRHES